MKVLLSLVSGGLFGAGLVLGGMTRTRKVRDFLDVTGDFDPSLAFVMLGAILVYAPAYRVMRKRERPRYGTNLTLPPPARIDVALVVGAILFGIGWGIAGFCPGPALTSVGPAFLHWTHTGPSAAKALIFVPSMLLGLLLGGRVPLSRR